MPEDFKLLSELVYYGTTEKMKLFRKVDFYTLLKQVLEHTLQVQILDCTFIRNIGGYIIK